MTEAAEDLPMPEEDKSTKDSPINSSATCSINFAKSFNISLGDRELAIRNILSPVSVSHEEDPHDLSLASLRAAEVREQWTAYLMRTVRGEGLS